MAFIFRKLDRKAAFYRIDSLEDGDVQADALYDLRTSSNALSVWLIEENRANLNRVIAALAAGRETLDKLDYALIQRKSLDDLGIEVVKEKGVSCDDQANESWHLDLRGLSGAKLVDLAYLIQEQAEFERVQRSAVATLIVTSVGEGFIDSTRISTHIGEKLRSRLPQNGGWPR